MSKVADFLSLKWIFDEPEPFVIPNFGGKLDNYDDLIEEIKAKEETK